MVPEAARADKVAKPRFREVSTQLTQAVMGLEGHAGLMSAEAGRSMRPSIWRSRGTRAASRASPCYDSMPACAACHCARRPGDPPCMMAAERECCRRLAGRELVLTADTLRPRDRGHDEFFLFEVLANADATLNIAAARNCCTRRRRCRRSRRRGPRRRGPRAVFDPLALEPPSSSCRLAAPLPLARRRLIRALRGRLLAALAPAGTDCDVTRPRVRGVFKVGARVMSLFFFGAVV